MSATVSAAARRATANRKKGSRWECDLRDSLRKASFDAERLRLNGREDEGDIVVRTTGRLHVPDFVVIEAKDATMDVNTFVKEALLEADNYARHRKLDRSRVEGVAVVKRRGKNWKESFVLTTLSEYLGLEAQ